MFRIFLSSAKLNFQPEAAACVQTGNSTAFLLRTDGFSLVAAHRVQEAELGRRQVLCAVQAIKRPAGQQHSAHS